MPNVETGGGSSPPRVIYAPDPYYSEEARLAKLQGTVVIRAKIGTDGFVHAVEVTRSLGMGLDQKAEEAVWLWRFEPAMRNRKPAEVWIPIEVNFRLY